MLPYGGYGNGAAMRVEPAALLARSPEEALALAKASAEVTHDHPEGIRGSQATALAINLVLQGESAVAVRREVVQFSGYYLARSVEEIRPAYRCDPACARTVPQALTGALERLYETVGRPLHAMDSPPQACGPS